MKVRDIRTIGSTTFWVFFFTDAAIHVFSRIGFNPAILKYQYLFAAFELFGICLNISSFIIERRERDS